MKSHPPYRLHDSLGFKLTLTSRLQEHHLDDQLKTLGLTRITWCILLAVENESLVQPSAISAFVGIDRTATSRALRQMEGTGMILRAGGETDKRTTTVQLTPEGRDLLALATPMARNTAASYKSKLDRAEFETLSRLLDKLRVGQTTALKSL
jgi:DNA-binding MarR family transcriptional regulator